MSVPVGVGPEVNQLEQVSSDDQKMSVARGRGYVSKSDVQGRGGGTLPFDTPVRLSHDACDELNHPPLSTASQTM